MSERFVRLLTQAHEEFYTAYGVEPFVGLLMQSDSLYRLYDSLRANLDLAPGVQAYELAGIPVFAVGRHATKVRATKLTTLSGQTVHFDVKLGQDLLESTLRVADLTNFVIEGFKDGLHRALNEAHVETPIEWGREYVERQEPGVEFSDRDVAERMCVLFGEIVERLER